METKLPVGTRVKIIAATRGATGAIGKRGEIVSDDTYAENGVYPCIPPKVKLDPLEGFYGAGHVWALGPDAKFEVLSKPDPMHCICTQTGVAEIKIDGQCPFHGNGFKFHPKIGSLVKESPNARVIYLVYSLTIPKLKSVDGVTRLISDALVLRVDTELGKRVVEHCLINGRESNPKPFTFEQIQPHLVTWRFKRLSGATEVGHVDELRQHLIDTGAVEFDPYKDMPGEYNG